MRPAITVVIPTFQCGQYLGQAVGSVLAQEFSMERVEIIVVDDGSTDGTADVAHAFGSSIRYIYQSNCGVAAARNHGVSAASGDYVAFLDADDYWFPDRLRLMFAELDGAPGQLVTTDYLISRDGKESELPSYAGRSMEDFFTLGPEAQLRRVLADNFLNYMIMIPRSVIEQVGGFDESLHYGEDWELWLRCLAAGHRVRLVRKACAVYRYLRPGSSTTRNDLAKASDRVRILSRYRDLISAPRWNNAVGVMHHIGLRESIRSHSYAAAIAHGLRLLLKPTYLQVALRARQRRAQREHSPEKL